MRMSLRICVCCGVQLTSDIMGTVEEKIEAVEDK